MSTPEGKVKAQAKALLQKASWWFFMPVSNGMGRHGIPDIIACKPTVITQDMVGKTLGLFVGIECKAPGKRANTSALQDRELTAINDAGGVSVVIDDASQLKDVI